MTSIFAGSDENGPRNRNKNHGFLGSFSYIYILSCFHCFLIQQKKKTRLFYFWCCFY